MTPVWVGAGKAPRRTGIALGMMTQVFSKSKVGIEIVDWLMSKAIGLGIGE